MRDEKEDSLWGYVTLINALAVLQGGRIFMALINDENEELRRQFENHIKGLHEIAKHLMEQYCRVK